MQVQGRKAASSLGLRNNENPAGKSRLKRDLLDYSFFQQGNKKGSKVAGACRKWRILEWWRFVEPRPRKSLSEYSPNHQGGEVPLGERLA